MAHIFLRNSLNDRQTVKLNLSFIRQYDVNSNDGDPIWLLEIATTYPSASGTAIPPYYVHNIEPDNTKLDDLIADAVSFIGEQIDWGPLINDNDAPFIESVMPLYTANSSVSIESNIRIDVKDPMPSAGLDLSEAKIIINNGTQDFDITKSCAIEGDPFNYIITWEPPFREYKYYE